MNAVKSKKSVTKRPGVLLLNMKSYFLKKFSILNSTKFVHNHDDIDIDAVRMTG